MGHRYATARELTPRGPRSPGARRSPAAAPHGPVLISRVAEILRREPLAALGHDDEDRAAGS